MTPSLPLDDIILPSAVSWWPLSYGWWLLLALILAASVLLGIGLFRRWRRHRLLEQQRLQLLQQCAGLSGAACATAVSAWLKMQLKTQHPEACALHGVAWLDYLNRHSQQPYFIGELAAALSTGLYQSQTPPFDEQALQQAALCWQRDAAKKGML